MKVVGYGRRSKDDGEKDRIEYQLEAINEWAAENDAEVKLFIDDGIPGGEIDNRPGFLEMKAYIEETVEADYLVVFDCNRIGRFKKRSLRTEVVEHFQTNLKGIYETDGDTARFYSMENEDDLDALEDQLKDATAENRRRAKFIRKGIRRKQKQNAYAAGGQPICATWDNINSKWIRVETEYQAIEKALRLIKTGEGLDTIAKILNKDPDKYARKERGGKIPLWTSQALWQCICKNDFLHTSVIVSAANNLEIDTELCLFSKKAILDARSLISHRNKRKDGKTRTWNFLFRGLARCGECGKAWTLSVQGMKTKSGKESRYYRCKSCNAGFNADHVEREVKRKVARDLGNKERFLWNVKKQCFLPQSKRRDMEAKLEVLESDLARVMEQRKVAQEFRFNLTWSKEVYGEKIGRLDVQEESLRKRLGQVENSLGDPDLRMKQAEVVADEFAKMIEALYHWQIDGESYFDFIKDDILVTSTPPHELKTERPDAQSRELMFQQEQEFYRWLLGGEKIRITKEKVYLPVAPATIPHEVFDSEKSFIDISQSQATFG